ncbi:MAG: DMT family transporter [Candidatus Heimdallarchaeota archaeon]|nr:DMT family transporter [Candidatus Heimdallarchaeota archaeon]
MEEFSNPKQIVEDTNWASKIAYGAMFLVVLLWGLSWPFGRKVATEELGKVPFTAAFIRFSFALPVLFVAVKLIDGEIKLPRGYLRKIAILGVFQISIYNFFFLSGLRFTSGSDAVLIINAGITTISIFLASKVYDDEKFTTQRLVGVVIAVLGVSIVFFLAPDQNVTNRLLGNLLIFGASISWSIYTVYSRPIYEKIPPLTFQLWATFFGWLLLGLVSIIEQTRNPTSFVSFGSLWRLAYLGIFAAALANTLFSLSVKHIGPSRTSVFVNLAPLFGVLFSVLLIDEVFSIWYIVSFGVIFTGIYVVNKS